MHFSSAFKPFIHLMCVYHKVDMYWCLVCTNWPGSVCWVEACVYVYVCVYLQTWKKERDGGYQYWPWIFYAYMCTHSTVQTKTMMDVSVVVVYWTAVFSKRDIVSLCHFKKQSVWESPVWHKNIPHSLQNHVVCVRFLCCEQRAQRLLFLSGSDGSLSTFSGKCCRGRGRITPPPGPARRLVVYLPISSLTAKVYWAIQIFIISLVHF